MTTAYYISEWVERYEVSTKGDAAKPGLPLRSGPLNFIRLKVHGHSQGTGFRRLRSIADGRHFEVFGIFCKFLEIAGDNRKEHRGWLLDEKNNPADADSLSFIMDATNEQVENALKVLSNNKLGWIEEKEFRGFPGNSGEIPAPYITEPNRTQPNTIQPNETEPEKPAVGKSLKSFSGSVESDRLKLYDALCKEFSVSRREDFEAMRRICDLTVLAHTEDEDIFKTVWNLAKDSKCGKKPIALFVSKIKKQLGWKP